MNELVEKIINDESISNEDKIVLIDRLINASHGKNRFITPGLYLRAEINPETEELDMQLWFRNEEIGGETMHGPTDYDKDEILDQMKSNCLGKNPNVK